MVPSGALLPKNKLSSDFTGRYEITVGLYKRMRGQPCESASPLKFSLLHAGVLGQAAVAAATAAAAAAKSVTRLDFLTCSVGMEVVTLVRRG